ncbi:MAG: hypothetical protein N2255_07160, partial [Kiritimatiellae bacterium]|nr:hypothetical protein [Kiritimatiellia bacterium]
DWRLAQDKNVPFSISRTDHVPRDDTFRFREFVHHKVSTGYEQEILQGLSLGLSVYYSSYDFADPDRLDFEQQGASLNLNLAKGLEAGIPLSEASTLSLSLGYTHGYTYGTRETQMDDGQAESAEAQSTVATATGSAMLKTYLRRDLTHWLNFTRYVEPGYTGGTYISDRFSYVLAWTPVLSQIKFSTSYTDVNAQGLESDYEDWTTRLSIRGPLTAFSWLEGFTQYSQRWNAVPTVRRVAGRDELIYDYGTWTTRVGGGLALARNLDFQVWVEHTERMSESSTLNYSRDTIAAILVYQAVFD